MKILKTIKNFFQTDEQVEKNKKERNKLLISFIGGFGFLSVSVLGINILHNPIIEDKISPKIVKNISEDLKISPELHGSSKNFFSGEKISLSKNFYLINAVEKISKIYKENGKISFTSFQEEELFHRKVAKKYTLKNISEFRKFSTAEKNVDKFSWRLLNKTVPVGFEIDMGELEEVFITNIK